ncbi:UDP-N-acetylmuramoyl-L-alanine--D-glutamate ligase [Candidatus Bipolaricaulota bacterium]|nr:UDP-N-acetylmuramoyl-L-alanine--D-glutamate ligase [Candidatus Bipolaricaulota bacterium]
MKIADDIEKYEGITVVGAGVTGQAVAEFLSEMEVKIFVSEKNEPGGKAREKILKTGAEMESGGHTKRALASDLLVVSPGVPEDSDLVKSAKSLGIPVIGEIELAYRMSPTDRIIGVTGTNGKTTTVRLIKEILKFQGESAVDCGNIGTPFIGVVSGLSPSDIVVLEVSSYQLETISEFTPKVGVLTNLEPDHLKRHGSFESYRQAKLNLFTNQTEDDYAVINRNLDPNFPDNGPKTIEFGPLEPPVKNSLPHQKENFGAAMKAAESILPGDEITPPPPGTLKKVFSLPHRLETIDTADGITFVNDSKGTNPSATIAAIKGSEKPIRLLLGGEAKLSGYEKLANFLEGESVRFVHLFGESRKKLARNLKKASFEDYETYETMKIATREAFRQARSGETVLLSPGCASFDEFENYEKRGKAFEKWISDFINRKIH